MHDVGYTTQDIGLMELSCIINRASCIILLAGK